MQLGCHIWSFPACTVEEAAGIVRALGLEHLDLGNARDLDVAYVATHVAEESARVGRVKAAHGMSFVDAFPQLAPAYSLNHPDPDVRAVQRRIYSGFLEFAERIGLRGVTFTPGRYWPGQTPEADFERSAQQLQRLVADGRKRGLNIRIEPHVESVTWTPQLTLRMLDAVPGLSLTLDYSHFVFHGIPHDHIAALDQHATHWHARQARAGKAQCRFDEGTIDFARIVEGLRRRNYQGVICLEYVHGAWLQQDQVDCVTETVRLRDHLRTLLAPGASETGV